jgi:DeoR/GlpR family transcriptional regulator of sugar metabolism
MTYIRTAVDAQTRREIAIELLQERGEVSVADLSERTAVSQMTIRRDLEALEQEGVLRRVHGGAIDLASRGYAAPYSVRAKRGMEAKARIGRAVADMIGERETVIIDVGTTTLQVAKALHNRRNLTVLTPSLPIANVLAKHRGIRLMLTGGQVTAGEGSLVGTMAEEAFASLRFDTFVMGIGGVSVESGCTEYSLDDARVKRAALACVRRCIVAAESGKLGKVTFAQVCPLERVDILVTDTGATKESLAALEAEHVEVVVA